MLAQLEKSKADKGGIAGHSPFKKNAAKANAGFADNRPEALAQRNLQLKMNQSAGGKSHVKQCMCAGCTGTGTSQLKAAGSDTKLSDGNSGSKTVQLLQCGKCGQNNSHAPTCPHYHAPAIKSGAKKAARLNHDDGSGYQKSGSGGDRHQKGQTNQITNANQNNFYRKKKK
jgi:hypothetical protein